MISIGDTIILESLDNQNEKELYRSKVIDIKESSIFIGPPIKEKTNRTEPILLENTSFDVQFVAKDKKVYRFKTKVLSKQIDNITMFELDLPHQEEFINIQRRSFIRVESQLKVKVFSLNNDFLPFDTYTTNISAGGLSLVFPSEHTLEKDQVVLCSFVLSIRSEDNVYIQQPCKVVRVTNNETNQYASLEFEEMSEADRQYLVRFCFEQQLALRKKGYNDI